MGNESSQIEKPQDSYSRASQDGDQKQVHNDEADALSIAGSHNTSGSNVTSASRALARDLEQSVMNSSQDHLMEPPPKKRRKRMSTQSHMSTVAGAADAEVDEAAVSLMQSDPVKSANQEDVEMASQSNMSGDEPAHDKHAAARKRLVKELRRLKKTVLVSSGKAKWAPRTNGAKWEVEKLPPSQWPNRQLTKAEEQVLAKYQGKVEEAKKQLADFDRGAADSAAGEQAQGDEQMDDEVVPEEPADAQVTNEVVVEEPEVETQPIAVQKMSRKQRKLQKRELQRQSRLNAEPEIPVEDEQMDAPPEPEPQRLDRPHQKRKRGQAQAMSSSQPQQPTPVQRKPPLRSVAGKHKTELVKSWLNNQAPSEDMANLPEEDDLEVPEPSRKRKRVSKYQDDDDDDFQAASAGDGEGELQPAGSDEQDDLPIFEPAATRGSANKTKQTKSGSPGNDEDDFQPAGSDDEDDLPTFEPAVKSGSSKKSKNMQSGSAKDDEDDFRPAGSDEEDDLPTIKPAAKEGSLKKPKQSGGSMNRAAIGEQPNRQAPITSSGPFTAEEKSLADDTFAQVLQLEGIREAELKQKICTWRTAGLFKERIEAALPARTKPAIRKFCQRRYHMLERGPWTAEEDEDLRTAQANYPNQWRKHQDIVGRSAADCKDRWTMHVQYSKNTGAWSQQEEQKLEAAVERAIDTIKNDSSTDPVVAADRAAIEDMLSWVEIAKQLGNKRNRKQCREKYANLKLRGKRESTVHDKKPSLKPSAAAELLLNKNQRRAKKCVRTFEIGDFYDIFVEIHTSFDDTSARFHDEENVLWSIVSMKNPGSRFSLDWAGGALRRTALEHALSEWKIDSGKVRRKLEKSETLPAKAKVLARLLEKSYAGRLHAMSRTFMPDMVGKSKEEIMKIKAERKAGKKPKKLERRSERFVNDTDEEDVGETEMDVGTRAPAVNYEEGEEEESDDERSEEEQSVCQRKLDAQLNGREEGFEEEPESGEDSPAVQNVEPRRRSSKPSSLLLEGDDPKEDLSTDGEDEHGPLKKEWSDTDSEVYRNDEPADPEHDAEILRRFAVAMEELDKDSKVSSPPIVYEDDDEDDEDDHKKQAADDEEEDDSDSLEGSTPVISRADFMKHLRA